MVTQLEITPRPSEHGFLRGVHRDESGFEAKYTYFVPHQHDSGVSLPLIVFLHGAGELGDDGGLPAAVGLGPAVRRREAYFHCFCLFPQAAESWAAGSADARRALGLLDQFIQRHRVNRRRIYLTGISMGGSGTWELACADPGRWAAIAPICGIGDPDRAECLRHVPCWCFHGEGDDLVPVESSRRMIAALRGAGNEARYTEYAGVGHNCWDLAYNMEALYAWLWEQRLL